LAQRDLDRITVLLHRGRVARWCHVEADHVDRLVRDLKRTQRAPTLGDFLRLAESHREMLLRLGGLAGLEDALGEDDDG